MGSVLVVEDEPAILRIVIAVLRGMGCDTVAARDAETASRLVSEWKPDVVIADVRLPGMTGVELTRRIKEDEATSSTPVLLMSAFGEPRGHPGDGFLKKPFEIEQLEQVVTEYLATGDGEDSRS